MSRSFKRLTAGVTSSYLFNKSARFLSILFPLLKHAFSKTLRFFSSSFFMEPFIFSSDHHFDVFSPDPSPFPPSSEPLFLVPFRWWNEAREALYSGGGSSVREVIDGVKYNVASSFARRGNIWEDKGVEEEIVLEMKREGETEIGEEGVSGHSGGGDLALISEWMFLRALKWHDDVKNVEILLAAEDNTVDLFSLQIRLSSMWPMNLLIITISQKDNEVRAFNRACRIFDMKSHPIQVWDFSGQTNQYSSQPDDEILLELQVYGLSGLNMSRENGNDEIMEEKFKIDGSSCSTSLINGNSENCNTYSMVKQYPPTDRSYGAACSLGLTGLLNLGNTCFMNSAIQCLAHTGNLVDYFLGDFRKDLNVDNPLGMKGNLAVAFADLLRKLWAPGASPVAPRTFKSAIAGFAPQFSGYNQHDSQEFLAFLLDGLHEDLNLIKCKPYTETKDEDTRPDDEVADEHWLNHLARNSSIIVELFQGQYRSTLVCPDCLKKSVTFDPFMYLSLPLPSATMRKMSLTVLSCDGTLPPTPVTITVPNHGSFKDLVQALSTACALRDDETLVVAEIFNCSILHILGNPNGSVELIRDRDQLVAYRMPKDDDDSPLVEFIHVHEKTYLRSFSPTKFGIPLVTRMSDFSKGSNIRKEFIKLLSPFWLPVDESINNRSDTENNSKEDAEMEDLIPDNYANSEDGNNSCMDSDFQFFLDNGGLIHRTYKIQMDEPVPVPKSCESIKVLVYWSEKMIDNYDTSLLKCLPEVSKPTFLRKRDQEPVSLDKCLDAFLKEEPLGSEDMWYCPNCKKHQQASKKLDLWRLPEILVIHLKRFSYNRYFKNKLDTLVDFPVDEFDLSSYLIHKFSNTSQHYSLYAVSNHYGGMGGGHYTAFAKHKHQRWYEFDDHRVFSIKEEQIKSSAAYILFYRRISDI